MATILFNIIILPIESIIELVFCSVYDSIAHFGAVSVFVSIIAVSLAVNFLALPLYNIADALQLKEREVQNKLSDRLKRIKKAFKGDEQFMMVTEYYRQNNYHPLYALRSSLSILIEIPFFIAAYHFLSHCYALRGVHFWIFKDLGGPDRLFKIGSFYINVLPILMTAINVVSSAIYTKGAPLKEKIQINVLAAIFLVILYNSPSGLVLYWILNNTFSLVKNVLQNKTYAKKIVYGIFTFFAVAFSVVTVCLFKDAHGIHTGLVHALTCWFIAWPFIHKFKKNPKYQEISRSFSVSDKQNGYLMFFSSLCIALLTGLVIPGSVIATSPVEFSFLGDVANPLFYIKSSFTYFIGLFLFWPFVIFLLFGSRLKKYLSFYMFVMTACALANVYLFKYNYGSITQTFNLDNINVMRDYSTFYSVMPLLFMAGMIAVILLLRKFNKQFIAVYVMVAICCAEVYIGTGKLKTISRKFNDYSKIKDSLDSEKNKSRITPEFHLSKDKPNVVVLFLDRAISDYFPYILEQYPRLKRSYSGFVYYPNCLSFGESTISGSPALLGGYEYTPDSLNQRTDLSLKEKQNEALMVMPKIFSDAGYKVTVANPPWLNYAEYIGDGKPLSDIPNVTVKDLNQSFTEVYRTDHKEIFFSQIKINKVCENQCREFSILQILYPVLRTPFYNGGKYLLSQQSHVMRAIFLSNYAELHYLPELTALDSEEPTFTFIDNETAHEPVLLLAPDMTPGNIDNNSVLASTGTYKIPQMDGFGYQLKSYHINAASIIQFGAWLDWLKDQGVYDNTRIIIVADHGRDVSLDRFKDFKLEKNKAGFFNPLFVVKDFNSRGGLITEKEMITNAETVNFAIKDLEVSNVNPFTNKEFKKAADFDSFDVFLMFHEGQRNAFTYEDKITFPMEDAEIFNIKKGDISDESNWTRKR